jgi:hypothetical protein
LLEIMPPAMVGWLRGRGGTRADPTTKAVLYQTYRLYDRVGGGPPGLPPFPAVVAELHRSCYQLAAAARALLDGAGTDDATVRAVEERVEHARRWLSTAGRDQCWIVRRVPPGGPAEASADRVAPLVERMRAADPATRWSAEEATALVDALFGTGGGAQIRQVVAVFGGERVADALAAYLRDGSRPLREATLAALDAPAAVGARR